MKNLLYLFVFLTLISCGNISPKGDIETKEVEVEEFVNLSLQGSYRVFYVQSDKNFVSVETYPNIFKNLNIKVKDRTLDISEKRETEGVDFYSVTVYSRYNPERITVTDSVEMNISSEIQTDNFRLHLKNNAIFIGSVKSRRAEVELFDTSRANFKGSTGKAVLKIQDTANFIAPYWLVENMDIDSRNGNYAEVQVKDSLKGSIKNTAKFLYYNDPIRAFKADKTALIENKMLD